MSAATSPILADYEIDFEGAVSRYSPVLFRVALRRLRNVEDAEDAVQDALLSAYRHIAEFQGRSKLSTWLTRIVTNAALMKLRRHSRRETLSLDEDNETNGSALINKLVDVQPNPESKCAQAEIGEKLTEALEQLSPKLRTAIQLCDLDGLSVREAAEALGIRTNTLKSRVKRARAALNSLLTIHRTPRNAAASQPAGLRDVAGKTERDTR